MNVIATSVRTRAMNSYLYKRHRQRGYVLLVLLLFVALLSIGLLAMTERIGFQIKRDREEELIHRGLEYSRAVRKYVKKFGRYPNSVADLENTNNIRFLRKRYKDPITGKDFKLLHYGDLQSFGSAPALANAGIASPPPGVPISHTNPAPVGNPVPADPTGGEGTESSDPPGAISATGDAPSDSSAEANAAASPNEAAAPALVGVVSLSSEKTIRVFNKEDHYNQWQFVYDPTTDHVGLLTTPNQPPLKGAAQLDPSQNQSTAQNTGANPGQPDPSSEAPAKP